MKFQKTGSSPIDAGIRVDHKDVLVTTGITAERSEPRTRMHEHRIQFLIRKGFALCAYENLFDLIDYHFDMSGYDLLVVCLKLFLPDKGQSRLNQRIVR